MLCLVNHARMSAGLSPFRAERHLARAAARHAADMGRRHYFAHVSPSGKSPLSRARSAGWRGGVGEVIAWGCGTLSTPRATLRAWLNSPPHRAILLGAGHRAGVGVKRAARGRAYWSSTSVQRGARRLPCLTVELGRRSRSTGLPRTGSPSVSPPTAHTPSTEQRDEVVARALVLDDRPLEPVDQVLERQRLGDVAITIGATFSS